MKILTYLGFTLLSIFIQFSVLDFIHGMLKVEEKHIDLKGTSQKRQLRDVIKDITFKPHALYYRTKKQSGFKQSSPAKFFSNNTLTELLAATDITTTVIDILYDENTTTTEDTYSTESLYTSTEFYNVTEITFFEKNNDTTIKPDSVPKHTEHKDCSCNFLVKVCDINCCCDSDCLESEIKLFPNCVKTKSIGSEESDVCLAQLPNFGHGNGLFCIVKINLPENKQLVYKKTDRTPIEDIFTWKSNEKSQHLYEYTNTIYKYGDPVWLLKNSSVYHADLPSPAVNSYCSGRKVIRFLKDESYSCLVNIRDLEMLQITKSIDKVTVISATPLSINSSVLNCTYLHCVNWTVTICNKLVCSNYCKLLQEPTCTEIICMNVARRIEYTFYYHDLKIINATIKFYVANISMDMPFMSQEVQVKFVLANKSIDDILKLSGIPGYLNDLPIIVSYADKNYTDTFFNNTMQVKRNLLLPVNSNGVCISSNSSDNAILFGKNRRVKCRYNHIYTSINLNNATEECKHIQNNVYKLLELHYKVVVSPFGDPQRLTDIDWLSIERSTFNGSLYGRLQERSAKLICFNLVTRCSMVFSFVLENGQNKIVSCKYKTSARNATLHVEDISTVVTFDISFMDVTKPSVFEYVTGPPNLNIHLPYDFFYPFRSKGSRVGCDVFIMILYLIAIKLCK